MKRQPKAAKILDWEELESAPNTDGAFSFLRSQNSVINIEEHRPRDLPQVDGQLATQDKTSTVDKTSSVAATSDTSVAQLSREKATARPYKIHRCYKAQDGHSPGENQLYGVLWHLGVLDGPDTKRITMGHIRLAQAANLSDKAVKRCLAQLVDKLAIEVMADEISASRTGHTYRIHSFKSILERRSAAGLRCVVRDKGVRFVPDPTTGSCDSDEARILPTPDIASTSDITSTVDISSLVTVDKTTPVPTDKTSPDTVDKTSPPLGSSLVIKNEKTTTTTTEDLSQIVAALSAYTVADHKAAERIVSGSRNACADASLEEIAAVVHLKAPTIVRNRAIQNPLGLLMRAVPLCFEESGILELRAFWSAEQEREAVAQRERERQRQETADWVARQRLKLEQTLADPSATEAQKARQPASLSNSEHSVRMMASEALRSQRLVSGAMSIEMRDVNAGALL